MIDGLMDGSIGQPQLRLQNAVSNDDVNFLQVGGRALHRNRQL